MCNIPYDSKDFRIYFTDSTRLKGFRDVHPCISKIIHMGIKISRKKINSCGYMLYYHDMESCWGVPILLTLKISIKDSNLIDKHTDLIQLKG